MNHGSWAWPALFLLGAWHGVNPGMGWLFAVALGMQEHSVRAVGRSLVPIGLGHALAIGAVVMAAGLVQTVLPLIYFKLSVALILFTFGLSRLLRNRHLRWVGMQVRFRELTLWSFLTASAHGAGLMLVPVLLGIPTSGHAAHLGQQGVSTRFGAVLVHTCGYLAVAGLLALLVYEKLGLALLRKTWFNLDLVWGVALIATGCLTLVV